MFGYLLRIISNERDVQTTSVAEEVELCACTPQLSVCFVNARVNFAQGASSLEMFSRENKSLQCDLCCSSATHSVYELMDRYPQVEAHLSRHFESR